MTTKERRKTANGMKYHLVVIENLVTLIKKQKLQKIKVVWNTRGTVTVVLYCRWRDNARRRSREIAVKIKRETPAVVQPVTNRSILQ